MRPERRTLPKSTYDSDMYNRAFPIGNALFFFAGDMMSLLCLPCGKLAFAKRSAAMKAPVGLLSGSAVCDSRWRGLAPTSSVGFAIESIMDCGERQDDFAKFIKGMQ